MNYQISLSQHWTNLTRKKRTEDYEVYWFVYIRLDTFIRWFILNINGWYVYVIKYDYLLKYVKYLEEKIVFDSGVIDKALNFCKYSNNF